VCRQSQNSGVSRTKEVELRVDKCREVDEGLWVSRASSYSLEDIRLHLCLRTRLLIRISWSESNGCERCVLGAMKIGAD
jgi:hypothetical protein